MFKRAIVTGASGFIGSHLVDALLATGAEVVAVDRRPRAFACKFIQADLARRGVMDPLLDQETIVFHLAANASVPGSVDDARGDFRDNVLTLFETLESARDAGSPVVFTSSAAVYDRDNALPLSEEARLGPSSPYGAAKAAGEAYCLAYHRTYGLDVRIARLFNIFGPRMYRFAIFDFVEKISRNPREIEILGDGEQLRDYLYVEDAVRALILIHEQGEPGEIYNVGSGRPIRSVDLARNVAAVMGFPDITIRPNGQYWRGDIHRWYADVGKLRSRGFEPTVCFEEGLRQTVESLLRERGETGVAFPG